MKLPELKDGELAIKLALRSFYRNTLNIFRDPAYSDKEGFKAIPMCDAIVNDLMVIKKNTKHTRFLDIGCGKGNTLVLAKSLGYTVFGIEMREEYKEWHKQLFGFLWEETVRIINAFDWLKTHKFKETDIVYAFQPIRDYEQMVKLRDKIVEQSAKGTIFLFYGFGFSDAELKKFKIKRLYRYDTYQKL